MAARVPPHNDDAEKGVVGSLLLDREAVVSVADFLRPEHFYNEIYGLMFQAMLDLYEDREPIDLLTLSSRLKEKKQLKQVGGSAAISKLTEAVPTSANVEHYARLIKDDFTKRQLIAVSSELNEMAFDESEKVEQMLDKVEQRVFGLSQKHTKQAFVHVKDALADSFERLDELHKNKGGLRGVPTGFIDLDNTLAGLQPSNMVILAARPGMGKTTLALNIAQNVAVKSGLPVGFFSLEMSKEELVDRLLVAQGNVDAWRLKTGRLEEEEYGRLSDAMGVLADSPLFIDETPGLNLMAMRTKARRLMAEQGVKLLVVDYLTLIQSNRRYDNRVQEVSDISAGLKNLARELKVPVLVLSQLNRAVEHRGSGQPQLADLRESGAIEQDADVVMFLYREDDEDRESVKLVVAKHRNGPLKTIDLRFVGDRVSFFSMEKKRS